MGVDRGAARRGVLVLGQALAELLACWAPVVMVLIEDLWDGPQLDHCASICCSPTVAGRPAGSIRRSTSRAAKFAVTRAR